MRFTLATLLLLFYIVGCGKPQSKTVSEQPAPKQVFNSKLPRPNPSMSGAEAQIFKTNVAEDLVLKLTPKFSQLSAFLSDNPSNLDVLFKTQFQYQGPEAFDKENSSNDSESGANSLISHTAWPIEASSKLVSSEEFWKPIASNYSVNEAKVGVLSVKVHEDADIVEMHTSLEGKFIDTESRVYGLKAKQILQWQPSADDWKISDWKQQSINIISSPKVLFEDVTRTAIKDSQAIASIETSAHRQILNNVMEQGMNVINDTPYALLPDWEASIQFTTVSVFDLDNDSFDDLLVLDRHAEPLLLRNNQNGGFENVTEDAGLLGIGLTGNSSLLFDYDNDGDADLLVGKSLSGSQFFVNEGGKFVADEATNELMKDYRFVLSGSVVDVNRDGLLDVYLCTYAANSIDIKVKTDSVTQSKLSSLTALLNHSHPFTDRAGFPNILLINKGGKFEEAKLDEAAEQWRHSYQSTWADYDRDGDCDLYVSNDFAPDCLLRNDTAKGSSRPKFTDVTAEVMPGVMGFGMGSSFGDYNSDGQLDLYVSNMYSKAGNRIFDQLGGDFDPRIRVAANGSFLYENQGGTFKQVAGLGEQDKRVSKVGWSFGGQMIDLNNDSKLDIYVPSGYYTAPETSDTKLDL
jgi:hypothetical protein